MVVKKPKCTPAELAATHRNSRSTLMQRMICWLLSRFEASQYSRMAEVQNFRIEKESKKRKVFATFI
jgi:hypothetical protein